MTEEETGSLSKPVPAKAGTGMTGEKTGFLPKPVPAKAGTGMTFFLA